MMIRATSVTAFLLSFGFVGCGATTIDDGPIDAAIDASDVGADTRAVIDTAVCAAGATERERCGACGTRSRECLSTGVWSEFSKCLGEATAPQCAPGESKTVDCGNCGKQTNDCVDATCMWREGACVGEGVCTPGAIETTGASCSDPSMMRSRTCSSKCTWGEFSTCTRPPS